MAVRPGFRADLSGRIPELVPALGRDTEMLGKSLAPPGGLPGTGPEGLGAAGAGLGTREVGMSHMLWHSKGRQLPKALASQVSGCALALDCWGARPLLRPVVSLSEPDVAAYISEPDPLP